MIRNYLKIAWRNLWRHRSFSSISIISLTVSLAVCLLLVLLLYNQYQFDRHHPHADRIYRVVSNSGTGEFASSPAPLGPALQEGYPGIEAVTRLTSFSGHALIDGTGLQFSGFHVEPSFFEIFDRPIRPGGSAELLGQPDHVILSPEWAERAFGDEDPVGQLLEVEGAGTFTVAGVMQASPGLTHLRADLLASFERDETTRPEWLESWRTSFWRAYNYILLEPGVAPEQFDAAFADLRAEHFPDVGPGAFTFRLQRVTDIALGPMLNNEIARGVLPRIAGLFLVGLMLIVLVAACFTFTNLSLARALQRTQEVGVRKTVGARRWQVAAQFVVEAVVLAFLALGLAMVVLSWMVPAFNALFVAELAGIEVTFEPLSDPSILLLFGAVTLAIGLLAGFYPAWALSAPHPVQVLGGNIFGTGPSPAGRSRLRRTLLGVQVCLSFVLIVSALFLYRQSAFMLESDYGFDVDHLVQVAMQEASPDVLAREVEQLPYVESVAEISALPVGGTQQVMSGASSIHDTSVDLQFYSGTLHSLLSTLGVELIAGRTPIDADDAQEVVINETAVRRLGFDRPEDAIDTSLETGADRSYTIVGVMADFHVSGFFESIGPLVLFPSSRQSTNYLLVRAAPEHHSAILEHLEAAWPDLDPVHTFEGASYTEVLRQFNAPFEDVLWLIAATTLFALLISALGMLGMAAYATQARVKEVGIRKVLGATLAHLTGLLSKEFLVLTGVALVVGLPISYFVNQLWLDFFAYRIEMGIGVFAIGILFLLLITLGTAGVQGLRVALTDPARSLRCE